MKLKSEEVVALAQLVFNKTNQSGVKACVKLFTLLQYCVCECMYFHPQQLDSIHVTILHKEEGAGLGFSLAGGADLENKVITVSGPGMGTSEPVWVAGGVTRFAGKESCAGNTRPLGRGQVRRCKGKSL